MTKQVLLLLTLFISLSGPAMGEYCGFGRSSNAAETPLTSSIGDLRSMCKGSVNVQGVKP